MEEQVFLLHVHTTISSWLQDSKLSHHKCLTVPYISGFAKTFCRAHAFMSVRFLTISEALKLTGLWFASRLTLKNSIKYLKMVLIVLQQGYSDMTVIFTNPLCWFKLNNATSCKCSQCDQGATCMCIPHYHFKEMLAVMSGKPHAICLGAWETAGQRKKTVECLRENIRPREANQLSRRETSSTTLKHTLLVVQIVKKLLSDCLAGPQRSFLIFSYCFAYCSSPGGGLTATRQTAKSAKQNTVKSNNAQYCQH